MAGITIEQAIDLGTATLESFKTDALEVALKHQTYEVLNQWFKKDKVMLDGGDRAEAFITLRDTGNASQVRMYETDTPNVANVDEKIKVEWTHAQTSFSYSIKELAMNKGNKQRIYSLFKQRRLNMYREFADLLEELAWQTPTGASDDRNPWGIPGWLVQPTNTISDANKGGGFIGYTGNYTTADDSESTLSTVGSLECSSTVNPRWANWYQSHEGNLDSTLLKKLRLAFRKTKFQAPMFAAQAIDPKSGFSNFRLYTTSEVLDEVEELAFNHDDRIGADLGKYAGAVIFKGIPFKYIDVLDDELTFVRGGNPIYGVNHNHFYPFVLNGENFRLNTPMSQVGQHNVLTVYLDLSYQYMCDNRRTAGFLLSDNEGA